MRSLAFSRHTSSAIARLSRPAYCLEPWPIAKIRRHSREHGTAAAHEIPRAPRGYMYRSIKASKADSQTERFPKVGTRDIPGAHAVPTDHDPPLEEHATGTSNPSAPTLRGSMVKHLRLVEIDHEPAMTYKPGQGFAVHPHPQRKLRLEHHRLFREKKEYHWTSRIYNKMLAAMSGKQSIHQKHMRGVNLGATQEMFSLITKNKKISTERLPVLGPHSPKQLHIMSWNAQRFGDPELRKLRLMSSSAILERDKSGVPVLLWVTIVPPRSPEDGQPSRNMTGRARRQSKATDQALPWTQAFSTLRNGGPMSPYHSEFAAVMSLFIQTFTSDGRYAQHLWGDKSRRNGNLPVVFSSQDQYIWFIWKDGPDGRLEAQYTGNWIAIPRSEEEPEIQVEI